MKLDGKYYPDFYPNEIEQALEKADLSPTTIVMVMTRSILHLIPHKDQQTTCSPTHYLWLLQHPPPYQS